MGEGGQTEHQENDSKDILRVNSKTMLHTVSDNLRVWTKPKKMEKIKWNLLGEANKNHH